MIKFVATLGRLYLGDALVRLGKFVAGRAAEMEAGEAIAPAFHESMFPDLAYGDTVPGLEPVALEPGFQNGSLTPKGEAMRARPAPPPPQAAPRAPEPLKGSYAARVASARAKGRPAL